MTDTDRHTDRHDDSGAAKRPPLRLPPDIEVDLGERGTLVARDLGPADAPAIVLLHGWTASADLNWFTCYHPLAARYRVLAFDHRGHARGLRSRKPFRLEDCADDAVDIAAARGVERFVTIGYSMGGAIAQLVWRRHPDRVRGLVLASTAPYFAGRRQERWSFLGLSGLAALARLTPEQARSWVTEQVYLQRKAEQWEPWAVEEVTRHDWRMVLEAGREIGNFSSTPWLGDVDVPTSVIVTMRDQVVPVRRQARLVESIPGAEPFRVDGEHDAVVARREAYVPTLIRAIESVLARDHDTSARRDTGGGEGASR